MSNEERGQDFLKFVAENEAKLKKNLKKNITYNQQYFDDAFGEAVIKVYDAIVSKGVIIKDYEQYFFIASKYQFIKEDNYFKKLQKVTINSDEYFEKNDIEDEIYEEDDHRSGEKLEVIREILEEEFGAVNTNLFLEYVQLKNTKQGTSYKIFAEKKNLPLKQVTDTIKAIKKFVANSPELKYIKSL